MTGGPSIIRKPGADRSNLELTNSLRSNFLAAQQDALQDTTAGRTYEYSDDEEDRKSMYKPDTSSWTTRTGLDMYIPAIDWSQYGLFEEPEQYEITVKLFYLPGASVEDRSSFTKAALDLVLQTLRVDSIDLLIVSFPGLAFADTCEEKADRMNSEQGDTEEELASWAVLERLYDRGVVRRLGLAEFGSQKLANFLSRVRIRPRVNQINVRDCCKAPRGLITLAKAENIDLLMHSDCTNILPSGTLRELLGRGPRGAGVLAESKNDKYGLQGDVIPQWVVKYTAVVRNRGVIEDKGYFASAELRR